MTSKLIDDCFRLDEAGTGRLSHDEVLRRLKTGLSPRAASVNVPAEDACGLIAAEDVFAPFDVPGHTNSAVDGFAFAHADLATDQATHFNVVGRSAAGHPCTEKLERGEAARIFTGAVMPSGVDTVAMQEDCSLVSQPMGDRDNAVIAIPPGLKFAANVRAAGEDVRRDDSILRNGDTIRPQDVAMAASLGRSVLRCYMRPRVAVVSTGDEVIRAGEKPLDLGQVYDANSPMLGGLVRLAGCDVTDLGIWPDTRADVTDRLRQAASQFDVVLTSGGASLGEEDHMSGAIEELGSRHFWQIAVKPGRPLMLGRIDDSIIIGLPGNPVAVFVCFLIYVRPLLRRLGGAHWPEPQRFALPAAFSVRKRKQGRREFWRGTLVQSDTGLAVQKYPRDGSGLISSLRAADGLIDIAEDRPDVEPGDLVDFIPFSEFGIITT